MKDNERTNRLCRRAAVALAWALIALCLMVFPAVAATRTTAALRVPVSKLEGAKSMSFSADCPYAVEIAGEPVEIPSGAKISVEAGDEGLTLGYGKHSYALGAYARIERQSTGTKGISFAQPTLPNRYCGDLELSCEGGVLHAVLIIDLEDYVCAVLGAQTSDSAPVEALKAMAVAARSRACANIRRHGSAEYDLADDTAFEGFNTAMAGISRAVEATKGVVLYEGGAVADCVDCASNGGQTESAANARGEAVGYLVMVDDPYDKESADAPARSCLIRRDLAGLNSELVNALKAGMAGALKGMELESAPESVTLRSINAVTPVRPRFEAPSRLYTALRFDLSVIAPMASSGQPVSAEVSVEIPTYGGLERWYALSLNEADNETIDVQTSDAGFTVSFARDGDGVGLSRCGAAVMAANYGMDYRRILDFYYPGTTAGQAEAALMNAPAEDSEASAQTVVTVDFALPTLVPVLPDLMETEETFATAEPAAQPVATIEPTEAPTATTEPAEIDLDVVVFAATTEPTATAVPSEAPTEADRTDAEGELPPAVSMFANTAVWDVIAEDTPVEPTPTPLPPLFASVQQWQDAIEAQASGAEDVAIDLPIGFANVPGTGFDESFNEEMARILSGEDDDVEDDGIGAFVGDISAHTFVGNDEEFTEEELAELFDDDAYEAEVEVRAESVSDREEDTKAQAKQAAEEKARQRAGRMKAPAKKTTAYATVSKNSTLMLRALPDASATATGYIRSNEAVRVLKYDDGWAYVETSSGKKGYASRRYLSTTAAEKTESKSENKTEEKDKETYDIPEGLKNVESGKDAEEYDLPEGLKKNNGVTYTSAKAKTTGAAVMYKSYSTSSKKLGTIPKGGSVKVTAYNDKWVQCEYKGHKGYVLKSKLKLVK